MKTTPIYKINVDLNENEIFVKRDDLLPFSFGGNKARKAELFFKEIEKGGYDTVVTYGSGSSNHCRIVANMAVAKGLRCVIISPEEGYEETANSKMVRMFGAEIVKTPVSEVSSTIDRIMEKLREDSKPYFIQGGGHGNTGTQAYVDAYKEICCYEKEYGVQFDYIFHASGTGTTQAGLVCGKILNGDSFRRIVGISIARKNPRGGEVVIESVNSYLDDGGDYSAEVEFRDEYVCGGYGLYDDDILKTIREVLVCDGMPLNTTYTGKAFCGMKKYIQQNDIKGKKILFINTGGTPLFFDDLEEILK